jgi:hypothetical protein
MDALASFNANSVAWAVSRWQAEVSQRPLVNVHRRTLDDTWRQVIRHFGGDPDKLIGPNHDTLLANHSGVPAGVECQAKAAELRCHWPACSCAPGVAPTLPAAARERLSGGHIARPDPAGVNPSEKGLGVCPTSRATLLEIEPNGRETEDSNRSAGEEERRGGEARRCDAARAGSAELGSRSGNAVQHEVVTAPGPSAPAAPPDATRAGWWCPQCRREVPPAEVTYQETHDPRAGGCGHPVGAAPVEVVRGIPRPQDMKTAGSAIPGVNSLKGTSNG